MDAIFPSRCMWRDLLCITEIIQISHSAAVSAGQSSLLTSFQVLMLQSLACSGNKWSLLFWEVQENDRRKVHNNNSNSDDTKYANIGSHHSCNNFWCAGALCSFFCLPYLIYMESGVWETIKRGRSEFWQHLSSTINEGRLHRTRHFLDCLKTCYLLLNRHNASLMGVMWAPFCLDFFHPKKWEP